MPLAGLDICKRSDPIRAEFGNHAAVVMAYSQFTFLFVAQLSMAEATPILGVKFSIGIYKITLLFFQKRGNLENVQLFLNVQIFSCFLLVYFGYSRDVLASELFCDLLKQFQKVKISLDFWQTVVHTRASFANFFLKI